MKNLVLVALGSLVALSAPINGEQYQNGPIQRHISTLTLTNVPSLEAILAVYANADVVGGIICSDLVLMEHKVSFRADGMTVQSALRRILEGTSYDLLEGAYGNLVIERHGGKSAVADLQIVSFHSRPWWSVESFTISLWGTMQMQINPQRTGYRGSLFNEHASRALPDKSFEGVAVQDLLSWVVAGYGQSAWVIWPSPERLIDASQERLWNIVFFDSEGKYCCLKVPKF